MPLLFILYSKFSQKGQKPSLSQKISPYFSSYLPLKLTKKTPTTISNRPNKLRREPVKQSKRQY